MPERIIIPANAGRSAKRVEHPKDGPEGVSEVNHPCFGLTMDSGLRRNDDTPWKEIGVISSFAAKAARNVKHVPRVVSLIY